MSDTTSTRNSVPMILGFIGGALVIAGAFFSWIAPATSAEGTSMPISLFWSTEFSTTDSNPSFLASAGFIVILIEAITLIGALLNRGGWVLYGGILALIAFVLIAISLMRERSWRSESATTGSESGRSASGQWSPSRPRWWAAACAPSTRATRPYVLVR